MVTSSGIADHPPEDDFCPANRPELSARILLKEDAQPKGLILRMRHSGRASSFG
jgi:hypothetical protein